MVTEQDLERAVHIATANLDSDNEDGGRQLEAAKTVILSRIEIQLARIAMQLVARS